MAKQKKTEEKRDNVLGFDKERMARETAEALGAVHAMQAGEKGLSVVDDFGWHMQQATLDYAVVLGVAKQLENDLQKTRQELKDAGGCEYCLHNTEEAKHPECTGNCEPCTENCKCSGCTVDGKEKWVYYGILAHESGI